MTNKLNAIREVEGLYAEHRDTIEYLMSNGITLNPLTKFCTVEYPARSSLDVVGEENRNKLAQEIYSKISDEQEIGLYIHIPWCTRSCTFCNFYFDVIPRSYRNQSRIDEMYINYLKKQAEHITKLTAGKLRASSIYFGGGSPSLLSENQVKRIIKLAEDNFSFKHDSEVSLEIHPEIVRLKSSDYLRNLWDAGVNRLSIGVQSSDNSILRSTARGHTFEEAIKIYENARQIFDNINIDLMYGFAGESVDSWYNTLETAFNLEPEFVTTYFLEIKPTSPEYNKYLRLLDDRNFNAINVKKSLINQVIAKSHGYEEGARNYWIKKNTAKDRYKHISGKWKSDDTVLVGLGPSTYNWIFVGDENNWMFYDALDFGSYKRNIDDGIYPIERAINLDRDETARRHLIFGLRGGGIHEDKIQQYLSNVSERTQKEIKCKIRSLQSLGLLQSVDGILTFTQIGNAFSHQISQIFGDSKHLVRSMQKTDPQEKKYEYYSDPKMLLRFEEIL